MLYNPKIIINNLDFESKMRTLSDSYLTNVIFMNPNMFKIAGDTIQGFLI